MKEEIKTYTIESYKEGSKGRMFAQEVGVMVERIEDGKVMNRFIDLHMFPTRFVVKEKS